MADLAYEPRAFWQVKRIDALPPVVSARPQVVVFDHRRFYNDQRWPIVITQISFAAIDYVLKRYANPGAGLGTLGYASESLIFKPRITISMRHRASFSKQPYEVASYANTPTADRVYPPIDTTRLFSSVFGYCYFEFPMPMELPADANIQFDLTNFNGVPAGSTPPVKWATAFHEKLFADIRLGEGRIFGGNLHTASDPTQGPFGPPISPIALVPNNDPTNALFPPEQAITPKNFAQQSPIASNSPVDTRVSKFTGISVAIDQIDYDDAVTVALAPLLFPACPLSLRTGVRARTRAGGSQTEWWRPGAPVALVMPTITPASVYTLERPITVAPGDQLEIEIEIPPQIPVKPLQGPTLPVPATYQIGVAANGYAAIEA